MIKYLNLYLKLLFLILITIVNFKSVNAEIIKKINIYGNERVTNETVLMFSNLEVGSSFDQDTLNKALKDLYYTDYFKEVEISFDKEIININVVENPIIQLVKITGVDDNNIFDVIKDVTSKVEKYPFVENKISDQVNLLKNILKSYGYYFVELNTIVVKNQNNTIDLEYNFNLGEIAKIKKIKFIGNKIFKDKTLRNIIISEEAKFWKFITRNKFLDTSRINADVERLNRYYTNKGYYNVQIKSTTAVITEGNQFELIFNIDAGNKYYFDEIKFVDSKTIPTDDLILFEKKMNDLKGEKFSRKKINSLISEINDFTLRNDFIFINADFKEIIKDENKIDIIINFTDLEKIYVDRINILGNFITDEKVIRNQLIVDEGDPYNELLFNKSIQNMKGQNIFKSVEYEIKEKSNLDKTIDITVEEKPTGEIFAGAGTGTTGSTMSAGVKENNYLGLGIKLDTNLTLTEDSIKGKFSVLNPNYNNSDKSIITEIESSTDDFFSSSGYKTSRTGLTIGTEFEQANDLFVNLKMSNYYEDLKTSSSANSIVKKQEGNYFENLVTYAIKYNRLDQNFQPSDGFINYFSQTLPIIADDLSIENMFTSSAYHSINENFILSAKFFLKTVNSLDEDVRISKRAYIPARRLRGFEGGKIGPKDGTQFVGGNYASSLNLNSSVPNLFFENESIDVNLFLDMANVWEVDYNSSLDSNKIRSATGIAIDWFSPIGPLSFSYAIPLSEANTDVTEKFRFQIGTSF